MTNPYFTNTIDLVDGTKARASVVESNFTSVEVGFDAVNVQMLLRGSIAGQVWTGAHNFTGATITAPTKTQGDNSTNVATTAYADLAVSNRFSGNLTTPGPIGGTTPDTGSFTTLSASSTVSGAGFTARFAAPGPIGSTTPSTGAFTAVTTTGAVKAGTSATGFYSGGDDLIVGAGSGNTGATIYSGTASIGGIYFADGTTGNDIVRGQLEYIHSTDSWRFTANATIVIGTWSTTGLAVTGTLSATGAASCGTTMTVTKNDGPLFALTDTFSTGQTYQLVTGGAALAFGVFGLRDSTLSKTVFQTQGDKTFALQGATPNAGTGITFPVTQAASTDVNTLDDYEEGTWTPTIGGTATYTTQEGKYTKIGNKVTVWGKLVINVIGTGSTTAISGLPFTSGNATMQYYPGVVSYWSGLSASYVAIQCQNQATASNVLFTGLAASGTSNGNGIAIFASGTAVHFSLTYSV